MPTIDPFGMTAECVTLQTCFHILWPEHGSPRTTWPLDAQFLHAAAQSARVEVQNPRRAAFAFNHPVGLRQHRLDVAALDAFERTGAVSVGGRGGHQALTGSVFGIRSSEFGLRVLTAACCRRRRAEVRSEHERIAGREQNGTLDDVLE